MYIPHEQQGNMEAPLAKVESVIKGIARLSIQLYFVDDDSINSLKAKCLSQIIACIFLLAIVISCLGLFGLAAYTAERRQKRLAFGSFRRIDHRDYGFTIKRFFETCLYFSDYRLPLSWVHAQMAAGLCYRITMSWWVFVLAGLMDS